MFFFVALFVASFILAAFFGPKVKTENAKAAGLSDFNFPRSKQGDPVPRIYGTVKFQAPNTIGQTNFEARPIKKKVKTGLFSSKRVITGYQYFSGLDLAIALGPEFVFKRIWFGKYIVWTGCLFGEGCRNIINIDLPELYGGKDRNGGIGGDIALYCGDFDQPQDEYLAANLDPNITAYPGIAHMVLRDFYFGNSANIQPIYVEGSHFSDSLGLSEINGRNIMPNGFDINPIETLYDLYINNWGNAGIDPSTINVDQWRDVASVVYDEGNGMSIVIGNPTEGADITKQILRQINAILYEDPQTGLTNIRLLRNDYNINTLPVFGPDQISQVKSFTKKLWAETRNKVRIKYTDRANEYARDAVAVADDFSQLRFQGKIRDTTLNLPTVYDAALANEIAARELSNVNVPLFQAELIFNRTAVELKPGDPFIFNWPEYGISQLVLRARKFGLGSLENGQISISCLQDEFSADAVVISPPTPSLNVVPDFSPQVINDAAILELPYYLDRKAELDSLPGQQTLMSFVERTTSYSLGYNAFVDDEDETEVLSVAPFQVSGDLKFDIDEFDGFANQAITAITIENFTGTIDDLGTFVEPEIKQGNGLFAIGEELFAYGSFIDLGNGEIGLNGVRRALIDTSPLTHLAGAKVWFFDGQENFFESSFPVGDPVDLYFTDFTATGQTSKANSPIVTHVPEQRIEAPLPPDYVTVEGSRTLDQIFNAGDTVALAWSERNRFDLDALRYDSDPADTAEAGTTYQLIVVVEGAIVFTEPAITGNTYNLNVTAAMEGSARILISAVRDGIQSYGYTLHKIAVAPADDALTIDFDIVTLDGDRVTF